MTQPRTLPETWEPDGRPDPLTTKERNSIAPFACDICGVLLLSLEVGPHYRAKHPNDAPRVTRR